MSCIALDGPMAVGHAVGFSTRPSARLDELLTAEVMTDVFAGWGGASLGMEMATQRPVFVCVNHCATAVHFHGINHPHSRHIKTDVWEVDPVQATEGRAVGLAWFSPDCRHFSRARGAAPVSKRVRSLAWVVAKWAKEIEEEKKPRVIMVENVREFQDWGPTRQRVDADGLPVKDAAGRPIIEPNPDRKGETFKKWVKALTQLGYVVEWRVLDAADYGVPQHRRRLFVIARRDGQPIVWPEKTHGKGNDSHSDDRSGVGGPRSERERGRGAGVDSQGRDGRNGNRKPYRTAADCIDWDRPCPSIFDRKRPLAEKTLRRIALGIKRYVIENPTPFIVRCAHGEQSWGHVPKSVDLPLGAVTGSNDYAVVTPSFVLATGQQGSVSDRCTGATTPLSTIVSKAEHCLVSPTLATIGYGEREGQEPRVRAVNEPLTTVVGGGSKAGLVSAFLAQHYTGMVGKPLEVPCPTVTGIDHNSLVAATLTKYYGNEKGGEAVDAPLHTVTSKDRFGVATAELAPVVCGVGGRAAQSPSTPGDAPIGTVTGKADKAVAVARVAPVGVKFRGESEGFAADGPCPTVTSGAGASRPAGAAHALGIAATNLIRMGFGAKQWNGVDEPLRTVTGQENKAGLVYAFLTKFFGTAIGSPADAPAPSVTGQGQHTGIVTVMVEGVPYAIVDIGLRMLEPRELARAQGFPDEYVLPKVKSKAVKLIGNSVPPPVVAALVKANAPELCAVGGGVGRVRKVGA